MSYNWNWFFSAFVQSAAALIAIIAAFIISKLLGESEKEEMLANQVSSLFIKRNDLIRRIDTRYFDWYDNTNIKYSFELKEAIEANQFDGKSDNEKLKLLFEIEPDLFKVDRCLEYLNEQIDNLSPTVRIENGIPIPPLSLNFLSPPAGIWEKLNEEKEKINNLHLESLHIIELFKNHNDSIKAKLNSLKPIKVTIYFLIIGLIILVIYPLAFLPLNNNMTPTILFSVNDFLTILFSIKGLLLIFLFLIINGIFIYFLIITYGVEKKYNHLKKSITEEITNIKCYSKYFND